MRRRRRAQPPTTAPARVQGSEGTDEEVEEGRAGKAPIPSDAPRPVAPRTRIGAAWTAVVVGVVLLIALLIFIFQNLQDVKLSFITFNGRFPLALSLLSAAVAGALVMLLLGGGRMIQLRRAARRHRDAAEAATAQGAAQR